jgi:hypothetical protein
MVTLIEWSSLLKIVSKFMQKKFYEINLNFKITIQVLYYYATTLGPML